MKINYKNNNVTTPKHTSEQSVISLKVRQNIMDITVQGIKLVVKKVSGRKYTKLVQMGMLGIIIIDKK